MIHLEWGDSMSKSDSAEKLAKLREQVPYEKIRKYPDPITGTPLEELSDKMKARLIFALAYDLGRMAGINKVLMQDLWFIMCPVDNQ